MSANSESKEQEHEGSMKKDPARPGGSRTILIELDTRTRLGRCAVDRNQSGSCFGSIGLPDPSMARLGIMGLPDSDIRLISHRLPTPSPPLLTVPLAVPTNIVRSYEKSKWIGLSGGTIALAGFVAEIPTQMMQQLHKMKLKLKFFDVRGDEETWTFFGPEIDFEPTGNTFRQPVFMTIPTCYVPVHSLTATVKIQAKIDDSWEDSDRSTVVDRKINFSILEFTPLRFLMCSGFFKKTIAHMLYIRQEGENEYEVIWCFYDDLMETMLEAEKQMELRDATSSGISGTFLMRHNDDVKVALEIPDCDIEDPTRSIPTREIWVSDAIVKVEFQIKDLGDRFNIKYITGKIASGKREMRFP